MIKIAAIRHLGFIFCLAMYIPFCKAQSNDKFQVAFYNVENLFDTIDDPQCDDSEFLPSAKNKWDTEKYNNKLNKLSQVISSLNNGTGPDVLGLCEVENKSVVEDLAFACGIGRKKSAYGVINYPSTDPRGIDVALMYKLSSFKVLHSHFIRFDLPETDRPHTRDILYVKGELPNKQVLHLFVNHFPSRREGAAESSYKRQFVAAQMRERVDSLLKRDALANIIIMGDFNDEPTDSSLQFSLGAACEMPDDKGRAMLYNTMCPLKVLGQGSYLYKQEWNMLDQLIISQALRSSKSKVSYQNSSTSIYKEEYLLEQEGKYKGAPLRTFAGGRYLNGYSDHLPVYLYLQIR